MTEMECYGPNVTPHFPSPLHCLRWGKEVKELATKEWGRL